MFSFEEGGNTSLTLPPVDERFYTEENPFIPIFRRMALSDDQNISVLRTLGVLDDFTTDLQEDLEYIDSSKVAAIIRAKSEISSEMYAAIELKFRRSDHLYIGSSVVYDVADTIDALFEAGYNDYALRLCEVLKEKDLFYSKNNWLGLLAVIEHGDTALQREVWNQIIQAKEKFIDFFGGLIVFAYAVEALRSSVLELIFEEEKEGRWYPLALQSLCQYGETEFVVALIHRLPAQKHPIAVAVAPALIIHGEKELALSILHAPETIQQEDILPSLLALLELGDTDAAFELLSLEKILSLQKEDSRSIENGAYYRILICLIRLGFTDEVWNSVVYASQNLKKTQVVRVLFLCAFHKREYRGMFLALFNTLSEETRRVFRTMLLQFDKTEEYRELLDQYLASLIGKVQQFYSDTTELEEKRAILQEFMASLEKRELEFLELICAKYGFLNIKILNAATNGRFVLEIQKTGSKLFIVNPSRSERREQTFFVNEIPHSAAQAWQLAYQNHIPVAPYYGEKATSQGNVRVTSRYCGESLMQVPKYLLPELVSESIRHQKQQILQQLDSLGISHGHTHDGNFVVEFIDKEVFESHIGNKNDIPWSPYTHFASQYVRDWNTVVPFVRLIDFDRASRR